MKVFCIPVVTGYTHAMKCCLFLMLLTCWLGCLPQYAQATPGEYSFRFKTGPSFKVKDANTAIKLGAEFDYEFGYGFGFNLLSQIGLSSNFVFQLIPSLRYDVLYFVPGKWFVLAGAGYEAHDFENHAMGIRLGTGLLLPLKKPWDFLTDINLFITPHGLPRTAATFDWMIGLGLRY